jgi:L-lysine exporter family protein LysE/ArgO
MFEQLIFGLLLGWGAAIPIGAINLEIIRRNLRFGSKIGLSFGMGACCADITYLALLSYGVLHFLTSPILLKIIGVVGSLILIWFGWIALRQQSEMSDNRQGITGTGNSATKNIRDGFLLTLINPFTIIFWSSASMTIAANADATNSPLYAGLGLLIGVLSWILTLNTFLHLTRHRISKQIMHRINVAGGLILIGLALVGLWRVFS